MESKAENLGESQVKKPTPDAILLSSKYSDGETITKWLVKDGSGTLSSTFDIHYQINNSTLSTTFDNNAAELEKLNTFISTIKDDDTKMIQSIDIVGYASPDGLEASNESLAKRRAMSLRNYISKRCSIEGCKGDTEGVALPWSSIESAVNSSSIPSKSSVLQLIESKQSQSTIEAKLKSENSWDYLKSNILPSMRYGKVTINYDTYHTIMTRTPDVVVEMTEVERIDGATVAVVEEVTIADSPYDNRPPQIVDEESYIIVIDESARSNVEYIETLSYLPLDY